MNKKMAIFLFMKIHTNANKKSSKTKYGKAIAKTILYAKVVAEICALKQEDKYSKLTNMLTKIQASLKSFVIKIYRLKYLPG